MSNKVNLTPVAKKELTNSKMTKGYFTTTDGFMLDRSSPRQALQLLTGAAKFAKESNRGIVIFPEGTRSLTGELLEFKSGSFKFAQKFYLPIVPVTITGTLQARK